MEIKIRTYYWNKENSKILGQGKIVITDDELCQIVNERYISGEKGVPMNLNKDDLIFESTIDEVKI